MISIAAWASLLDHLGGALTVSEDAPRCLFLMRHAQHSEGDLTEEGLGSHPRVGSSRFSEWVQAEWRNQPKRTVRVWFTSTSNEVQETADVLDREECLREFGFREGPAGPVRSALPRKSTSTGRSDNGPAAFDAGVGPLLSGRRM